MPELPEVETVKSALAPYMEGAEIVFAKNYRENLRYPFPEKFSEKLRGTRILSVKRRGKYLIFFLSSEKVVISHLGMSGKWRIEACVKSYQNLQDYRNVLDLKKQKHDHFAFILKTIAQDYRPIFYNDPRRFGFLLLLEEKDLENYFLNKKFGVEPLEESLTPSYLKEKFLQKKQSLKAALLEQNIIAGLGNIYVCEALWQCGLSPTRLTTNFIEDLEKDQKILSILIDAIKDVLKKAIAAGGSTLRDYKHIDGGMGYFQHSFSVYNRESEKCLRCGETIRKIKQNGRSTYYCPKCQK